MAYLLETGDLSRFEILITGFIAAGHLDGRDAWVNCALTPLDKGSGSRLWLGWNGFRFARNRCAQRANEKFPGLLDELQRAFYEFGIYPGAESVS